MFGFFKKKKKGELPPWLLSYQGLDFHAYSEKNYTFAVLDCETTGLSKTDDIITLGAVVCTSREIFTERVLDQKYPLSHSDKSSEIHGELGHEEKVNVHSNIEKLLGFLENHIIVGHNIAFDVGKINQLLQRTFGVKLKNQVLDTASLAIRLDPVKYERTVGGQSNLGLDDLCQHYHIPIENRHTALGDAYLTAQLLQRLIYQLDKKGIKKLL